MEGNSQSLDRQVAAIVRVLRRQRQLAADVAAARRGQRVVPAGGANVRVATPPTSPPQPRDGKG